jgi:hypothetical protein
VAGIKLFLCIFAQGSHRKDWLPAGVQQRGFRRTGPGSISHPSPINPSLVEVPPSTVPGLHSIGVGCGWCRRGGIGTEQQGIEPGFDICERSVFFLQPLDVGLDQLKSRSAWVSISFVRLLLSSSLICVSMVGGQFNCANKRRHGDKKERNCDLLIDLEPQASEEIDLAARSEKGDQSNQQTCRPGRQSHGIQPGQTLCRISGAVIGDGCDQFSEASRRQNNCRKHDCSYWFSCVSSRILASMSPQG